MKDINRVTLQVGKYSVKDIFDTNAYANDPRIDFLNWSIWASGAFDYPADRLGLTWGLTAELNRQDWSVRAGYFLVPFEIQCQHARHGAVRARRLRRRAGDALQAVRPRGLVSAGDVVEQRLLRLLQRRHGARQPGSRLERQRHDALDAAGSHQVRLLSQLRPGDSPTRSACSVASAGTTAATRSCPSPTSTPACRSACQIKGKPWGRPDDRVGIAGAWNNISGDHSAYLAAGGLGPLVGDGALSYASENVFEAYYAFQLAKGIVATADYQFLGNPAYNIVRGPVSVFSGRLRMSF